MKIKTTEMIPGTDEEEEKRAGRLLIFLMTLFAVVATIYLITL